MAAKKKRAVNPFGKLGKSDWLLKLDALRERYGSWSETAKRIGVKERTLRTWRNSSVTPGKSSISKVNRMYGQIQRLKNQPPKALLADVVTWLTKYFTKDDIDDWTRLGITQIFKRFNISSVYYYKSSPQEGLFVTPDDIFENEFIGKKRKDLAIVSVGTILYYPKYIEQASQTKTYNVAPFTAQVWDLAETLNRSRSVFFAGDSTAPDGTGRYNVKDVPERFIGAIVRRKAKKFTGVVNHAN